VLRLRGGRHSRLGRLQGLQDHQQRQPDPFGQQRLVLGVDLVGVADDSSVGDMNTRRKRR
jgi:hypothetical protein